MTKPLVLVATVLGIVFLGLAAYYLMTPAGSLPSFFPGFAKGGVAHHSKHAIAAFIVALGLFALAWFQSKPGKA